MTSRTFNVGLGNLFSPFSVVRPTQILAFSKEGNDTYFQKIVQTILGFVLAMLADQYAVLVAHPLFRCSRLSLTTIVAMLAL